MGLGSHAEQHQADAMALRLIADLRLFVVRVQSCRGVSTRIYLGRVRHVPRHGLTRTALHARRPNKRIARAHLQAQRSRTMTLRLRWCLPKTCPISCSAVAYEISGRMWGIKISPASVMARARLGRPCAIQRMIRSPGWPCCSNDTMCWCICWMVNRLSRAIA